jgi:hypothetical protein
MDVSQFGTGGEPSSTNLRGRVQFFTISNYMCAVPIEIRQLFRGYALNIYYFGIMLFLNYHIFHVCGFQSNS